MWISGTESCLLCLKLILDLVVSLDLRGDFRGDDDDERTLPEVSLNARRGVPRGMDDARAL